MSDFLSTFPGHLFPGGHEAGNGIPQVELHHSVTPMGTGQNQPWTPTWTPQQSHPNVPNGMIPGVSNLPARNQVSNLTRDLTQQMQEASTVPPGTQTHQDIIMASLAQQGIRNVALAPDPSSEEDFRQMDMLDMLEAIQNNGNSREEVEEEEDDDELETTEEDNEEEEEQSTLNGSVESHWRLNNIMDSTRASAKRKEKSAMGHLRFFINTYYKDLMPEEGGKRLLIDPLDFTYTGKSPHGMNNNWWDNMIGCFLGYLGGPATQRRIIGGKKLSYGTADGYASAVKMYFMRKFRAEADVPVFKENNWRIGRFKLRKAFEEHCRITGQTMNNPHVASTEEDRRMIAVAALFLATRKMGEFWNLNNTSVQLSGRGSEVSLNHRDLLTVVWIRYFTETFKVIGPHFPRHKTGQYQTLPIFPHRDFWEEDWYLSLTYHFIMMSQEEIENGYLFPNFARQALKTSKENQSESKVSSYWKECFQEVYEQLQAVGKDINKHLTSHCGKKGANQHLAEMESVSPLAQIFRSGWEVRNIHSLFDYVIGSDRLLQQAGKAVSNWTTKVGGVTVGGFPPTLDCLSSDPDKDKLDEFVSQLFKYDVKEKWRWDFRNLMTGSLLRHYEAVLRTIKTEPNQRFGEDGSGHPFIAEVKSRLADARVTTEMFTRWQLKVRKAFAEANFSALPVKCLQELMGTSYDPLKEMNCDPRTLMDNYNDMVGCHNEMNSKIGALCENVNQLHLSNEQVRQSHQQLIENQEIIKEQNKAVMHLFKAVIKLLQQQHPAIQHYDISPPPPDNTGTTNPTTPEVDEDDIMSTAYEPREPASVLPFSTTSAALKCMTLADHFVYFFDKDVLAGYELDLHINKNTTKELKGKPDQLKIHCLYKKQLSSKLLRTKRAVRLLLFFCDTFPPYPRPRTASNQKTWRRKITDIAKMAQAALLQELFPMDPPDSISIEPFLAPGKGNNAFIFKTTKDWNMQSAGKEPTPKERFAPPNSPEDILKALGLRVDPNK